MEEALKTYLKQSARSFYLSLKLLPTGVRAPMATAYALCRLADTIADTDLFPPSARLDALNQFTAPFERFPISHGFNQALRSSWQDTFSGSPAEVEEFIHGLDAAANALQALPRSAQALVAEVVLGVARGMRTDVTTLAHQEGTMQTLASENDLEDYLLSIGGEPGRFWCRVCLWAGRMENKAIRDAWVEHGIQFGKGLQMVNILRDLPEDLPRGRCYLPQDLLQRHQLTAVDLLDPDAQDRAITLIHALIDQTIERLRSGLAYMAGLGRLDIRLRLAGWLPLSLALRTLVALRNRKSYLTDGKRVKVTRKEVYQVLAEGALMAPVNRFLKRDFDYWADLANSSAMPRKNRR